MPVEQNAVENVYGAYVARPEANQNHGFGVIGDFLFPVTVVVCEVRKIFSERQQKMFCRGIGYSIIKRNVIDSSNFYELIYRFPVFIGVNLFRAV